MLLSTSETLNFQILERVIKILMQNARNDKNLDKIESSRNVKPQSDKKLTES